jgi:hypothetical protein
MIFFFGAEYYEAHLFDFQAQKGLKEAAMTELLVFHSGNPSRVSCKKAIGVVEEMKKKCKGGHSE